jgi:hypothetical protein
MPALGTLGGAGGQKHLQRGAGKTTVPMSRPSATRPGAGGTPAAGCVQRAAHRRVGRHARGQQARCFAAQFVADVAPRQPDAVAVEAQVQRRPGAPARLVVQRHALRCAARAVARYSSARIQEVVAQARARAAASVPLPEAVGPSMVITGTSVRVGLRQREQGLEVVGEGLGHAAGSRMRTGRPGAAPASGLKAASDRHMAMRWSS